MDTMLDEYYRVSGAVVNVVAVLAANAQIIFTQSTFAQQIGTKGFIPTKLRVRNNNAGACWLFLGTGAAAPPFANMLPAVRVLNNIDNIWEQFELERVEFFASMTCYADAMPGGGTLDVQVEVMETG